jgi:hypothetical protein
LESQICFFLSLERLKIKGPTRRAKTDKGHLCLSELKLSFDDDYIGWKNSKDSATCTREEQPINLHDIYQPTINNYDWLFEVNAIHIYQQRSPMPE